METWIDLIQQVLLIVITAVVPILTGVVINYLRKKGILETLQEKRQLVEKGVEFAEQAYFDLNGEAKYDKAVEWITERFKDAKINFTETEVKGLIEAAVFEMKNTWQVEYDTDF